MLWVFMQRMHIERKVAVSGRKRRQIVPRFALCKWLVFGSVILYLVDLDKFEATIRGEGEGCAFSGDRWGPETLRSG